LCSSGRLPCYAGSSQARHEAGHGRHERANACRHSPYRPFTDQNYMTRRYPDTVTLIPTYNCTAACEHCCFGSHPGITTRLSLDRIVHHIDQAAALGSVRLIVFTGGECFLLGNDLTHAVARCTHHGLSSRCVSNAYWATTEHAAIERLRPLADAGLGDLNVSTGDAHQAFVPVARIINAMRAASALNMRALVVVESRRHRSFSSAALRADPRWSELVSGSNTKCNPVVFESPWMSMDPSAPVDQPERKLASLNTLPRRSGCDSVLRTIVVTPDERLGACCGLTREQIPELSLGSLRSASMHSLVDGMFDDFLKIWVALDGPDHILAWAADRDPEIRWQGRFAHHCDSCRFMYSDRRVRTVISEHWEEVADDVLFRFATMTSQLGVLPKMIDESTSTPAGDTK
jgi:hypothetical protein